MSTKIGHFEILSELSKCGTGAVYKANDPGVGQTVALKVIQLSAFGHRATELQSSLIEEAAATKVLSNPNLTVVYGAGEIEGQFCAAMEYIQGNSVATMLARHEGFSIWDLLDTGRQVCSALDHAHSHEIFHYSIEPAKIMCGWDGMVRVLGFGVSSAGKFTGQIPGIWSPLYYMSPEQIRGDAVDARSNLYSLGTLFYEMVSDRKAFEAEDSEALRQDILKTDPIPPVQLNPKLHPLLSDLILKAMSKHPADRYQSGRELLADLEKCKETKSAAAKSPAAPTKAVASAATPAKAAATARQSASPQTSFKNPAAEPGVAPRAVAASAGAAKTEPARAVTGNATAVLSSSHASRASQTKFRTATSAEFDSSSSAVADEADEAELETFAPAQPRIAVDPMMSGDAASRSGGVSFSEMTELPPLKEICIAQPPPPTEQPPLSAADFSPDSQPEKSSMQPRDAAQKAIKEIKNVPASLMIYSIAGAAVLILIIAVALVLHVNRLNSDAEGSRPTVALNSPYSPQPAAAVPTPEEVQPIIAEAPHKVEESAPAAPATGKGKRVKPRTPVVSAPVALPGMIAIDSTPQGAQIQIDGKTDPSWITPFTLSGFTAGSHTVTVTKPGYSTDARSVDVVAGAKSFLVSHLSQLMATLSVTSVPAGANIYIDGRDSGKLTPAQISVDKGQHVVLVRKGGYIDETTSAQFILSQTVTFSPALRALGNVDDIRPVNKIKKLFGGKEASGMGSVFVKTLPKGAQIAVNQHMLEKSSPVDFMLDPGNYIVDITLTGYAPIHKVITVDKGGKAVIDEALQHE